MITSSSDLYPFPVIDSRSSKFVLYGLSILTLGLSTASSTASSTALALDLNYEYEIENSTSSCTSTSVNILDTQSLIFELRRLSALSWDQLANLFKVHRRALHFWANGKGMSQENEEHLQRLMVVMHKIDSGISKNNRSALLLDQGNGITPFQLLSEKKYEQAISLMGENTFIRPQLSKLSYTAKQERIPTPPNQLIGAIHDEAQTAPTKIRSSRSTRFKENGGSK